MKQSKGLNGQWRDLKQNKKRRKKRHQDYNDPGHRLLLSGTAHLKQIKEGAVVNSEDRPTGVQFKREAKLSTITELTTMHAVCRRKFIFITYVFL